MERAIILTHKKLRRQFIISNKTKPNTLKNLIKKALRLQGEIKHFRGEGSKISIEQLISQSKGNEYEIILDDESSEDKSKSDVSQKNMSKVSGRKNPPSEHQLLDSKFYVDDFQLFMSEVSAKKTTKLFGIVFFNSRKKASFLGKKILRELIFEFDKIEFFYALHPIKMHTSSALLGEVLVFALFRGKIMIHQREFPEQITAADQIPNYIKNLVKIGQLSFDQPLQQEQKKTKNLIHVHEQRSFDHKIEDSPQKLSDFGNRPNRTTEIIKIKPITPDKEVKARKIFANPKPDSAVKSPITNQISFQNDFYQPQWFFQGEALTRLEKGILSALIKTNDNNLITFINGLSLKDRNKEKLNIKLLKVFLKEYSDQKLANFTPHQKTYIEENQENRKSFVFNALLKLYKFGDIKDFIDAIAKGVAIIVEQTESKPREQPKVVVLYSNVVKNTQKAKSGFTIKLKNCENEFDSPTSPCKQHPSPFREDAQMHRYHTRIAKDFYDKPLPDVSKTILKDIDFSKQFNEGERAEICDLLLKNDAFLIETFFPRREKTKKMQKMPSKTVKRYLREVESRYEKIRERTVTDAHAKLKMHKLQIFNGLVYFLYKQRIINKKQLKISFYLYTWSDLNILSAFELYLFDRNLEQFVDTIYSIDYNYYLHGLYQIDHSEVELFTISVEQQLIILFLYETYIDSGEERISLEKFIRAGDTSLLDLYTDLKIDNQDLIRKMIELSKVKKEELDNINNSENRTVGEIKEKKKDRCNFIDQIVSNRYKTFTKKDLVQYCINHDEPIITSLFDLLDQTNEQMEWVDSFNCYIARIDEIHMKLEIQELAKEANIELSKIEECRTDIIKGIYEAYLVTNDRSDTIDSLERAIRKVSRVNSPRGVDSSK